MASQKKNNEYKQWIQNGFRNKTGSFMWKRYCKGDNNEDLVVAKIFVWKNETNLFSAEKFQHQQGFLIFEMWGNDWKHFGSAAKALWWRKGTAKAILLSPRWWPICHQQICMKKFETKYFQLKNFIIRGVLSSPKQKELIKIILGGLQRLHHIKSAKSNTAKWSDDSWVWSCHWQYTSSISRSNNQSTSQSIDLSVDQLYPIDQTESVEERHMGPSM